MKTKIFYFWPLQKLEQKKRHLRQLADSHYTKAVQQFQQMDCSIDGLRVQLEWLALLDFTLTGELRNNTRLSLISQILLINFNF